MIRLGIVTALAAEQRVLTRQPIPVGGWKAVGSMLIARSGTGPERATAAARRLLENGAAALVSWGCAAGLDPRLGPGSLLIPRCVRNSAGTELEASEDWRLRLTAVLDSRLRVHSDPLFSCDILVSSRAAKQTLATTSGAAALDMESFAIAQVAADAGIPFLALRAVADPAEMNLPPAVGRALDAHGNIHLPTLFGRLLAQPGQIPALIQLGRHFNAARSSLKTAIQYGGDNFQAPVPSTNS